MDRPALLRFSAALPAIFLLATRAMGAPPSADDLLTNSGLQAGVALIDSAAYGETALDLASRPGWKVMVVEPDDATRDALGQKAAERGLVGRSLFLIEGDREDWPFANYMIDLALLRPKVPSEAAWEELTRVMAPGRGVAYVAEGEDAPRGWSHPDGSAWAVTDVPPPSGIAVAFHRSELPGTGWWTHRMHDAGNNAASTDQALQTPIGIQYLATPLYTSFQGIAMTSNGRHIEISDSSVKNPSREALASRIRARSITNGSILWDEPVPEGYESDMPTAALDGDSIYLADPGEPKVLVLNAETGEQTTEFTLSDDANLRVQWIGIEDGRLYALLGEPFPLKPAFVFIGTDKSKQAMADRSLSGSRIAALDLESGNPLWTHEEDGQIDYRNIGVREGNVYFLNFGKRLASLGPDGSLRWENTGAEWLGEINSPAQGGNLNTQSSPTLTVGEDHLRVASHRGKAFFVRTDDGVVTAPTGGPAFKGFFLDGAYRNIHGITDPATGEKTGSNDTIGRFTSVGGCGMVTWIPGLDAGVSHTAYGFKSPCGIGSWSAGGALIVNPSHCDCSAGTNRGATAFMHVGELFEKIKQSPEHPLETFNPPATEPRTTAADWTQARGNIRHNGAAPVTTPTAQPELRHIQPAHPLATRNEHDLYDLTWYDRPTPAVTAGSTTIWADSTGTIHAVDSASGERKWSRVLSTPILSSPVVGNGQVYFPGADGWVYCLNVADGSPVWRWRAAPAERLIMVYGKPMSSWPTLGLALKDEALYGVAGLSQTLGSVVFRLDATTGEPEWTSLVEPDFRSASVLPQDAFNPAGELGIVGDKLWVRSDYIVGIFDRGTGNRIPLPEAVNAIWEEEIGFYMGPLKNQGREFVQVRDDLILQGGQPLFDDTAERRNKKKDFLAYAPTPEGNLDIILPMPFAIPNATATPAADGTFIAIAGGGTADFVNTGLSFWKVDGWKNAVTEVAAQEKAAQEARAARQASNQPKTNFQKMIEAKREKWAHLPTPPRNAALPLETAEWSYPDLELNAVAMTENAVLAAHGTPATGPDNGRHPGFSDWQLTAYNRADGKALWSVALPSEPVTNGIVVDRDGRSVVIHRDGSASIVGSFD